MGGGFLQIAAYGEEDIYLTGNPQITFFVSVYKRYTNFSIENIKKNFIGESDFGKKNYLKIDKTGDLINNIFLYVKLPSLKKYNKKYNTNYRWVNNIGHAIIDYVNIEIGGVEIDRHYGLWLQIWSELTLTDEKKQGYYDMIGYSMVSECCEECCNGVNNYYFNKTDEYNLYIPLQFWFCRDKGLSLPIIALQHQEVRINVVYKKIDDVIIDQNCNKINYESIKNNECSSTSSINKVDLKIVESFLYIDYIYLADNERNFFAKTEHEYLIEQVQLNTNKLYTRGPSNKNDVKKETCNINDECDTYSEDCAPVIQNHKIDINFKHPIKELVWVFVNGNNIIKTDTFQGNQWFNFGINRYPNCSDTNNYNDFSYSDSKDISPLLDATLYIEGKERMEKKEYQYYKLIQPYQRHTNIPDNWIYLYSFAFNPESIQPSGTCNFSRIDNSHMIFNISKYLINPVLNIFATNYNILTIKDGLGGVMYK